MADLKIDPSKVVKAHWCEEARLPALEAFTTTRQSPIETLCLPATPYWLKQVHQTRVIHLDDWHPGIEADGAWTDRPGQIAVVKTADCLPILMASGEPSVVAAIHAGWRGLAAGMIGQALAALPVAPTDVQVWLGPAISQAAYEVDGPVFDAFVDQDQALQGYFQASQPGRWWADLAGIATWQLKQLGVERITNASLCTASMPQRFFSYRRGLGVGEETARMASLIWLA